MSVNTRFADFPNYMPAGKVTDPESLFTGWMLLSYRKPATASSVLARSDNSAPGTLLMKTRARSGSRPRTRPDKRSPWISAPGKRCAPCRSTSPTIYRAAMAMRRTSIPNSRSSRRLDGKRWQPLATTGPERRDRPNAYFQLPSPVRARYVRYVHGHVGAAHLAISDLRVFGDAGGSAPRAPANVKAVRAESRMMTVSWQRVPGRSGTTCAGVSGQIV